MPLCYAREETLKSDGAVIKEPAADHHVLYHERGFTEQIVWYVESSNIFLVSRWLTMSTGLRAAATC